MFYTFFAYQVSLVWCLTCSMFQKSDSRDFLKKICFCVFNTFFYRFWVWQCCLMGQTNWFLLHVSVFCRFNDFFYRFCARQCCSMGQTNWFLHVSRKHLGQDFQKNPFFIRFSVFEHDNVVRLDRTTDFYMYLKKIVVKIKTPVFCRFYRFFTVFEHDNVFFENLDPNFFRDTCKNQLLGPIEQHCGAQKR